MNNEFPKLSKKEFKILQLLISNGEMFGLEMVEASTGELKRGTIYVTLQRMGDKGYVESREEPRQNPEIGSFRRKYSATQLGNRAFDKNLYLKNIFNEKLLSLEEVSQLLHVSTKIIDRWIESDEIPYVIESDDEIMINKSDILSDETKYFFDEGMKWLYMNSEKAKLHGEYWFNKAFEYNKKFAVAYVELGRMYLDLGFYYESVETLKKAYQLNPDSFLILINLGISLNRMQMYSEAEFYLKNAIKIDSNTAKAYSELGFSLCQQKSKEKSLEALDSYFKSYKLLPDISTAEFIGRLLTLYSFKLCDFIKAENFAEEIQERFPETSEFIRFLIKSNQGYKESYN